MCPLAVVWLAGCGVVCVLAAGLASTWWWVGWLVGAWRWIGWLCGLFGGESGDGFLVFGHGGNWHTPGRDVCDAGVQPEHVTTPSGAFRVIIVNAVVVLSLIHI